MNPRSNPGAAVLTPAQLVVVHTGDIAGVATRFYLPPIDQPDMPWVALDDIELIGAPDVRTRQAFAQRVARFAVDGAGQAAAIAPYWLASEYLRSAASAGRCELALVAELRAEAEVALREAAVLQPLGLQLRYLTAARARLRQELTGE